MTKLVITYVALVALALASWLVVPAPLALPIAVAKATLIVVVFMELANAHAVAKIAALVALGFVALLCAGAYVDIATR